MEFIHTAMVSIFLAGMSTGLFLGLLVNRPRFRKVERDLLHLQHQLDDIFEEVERNRRSSSRF